MMNNITIFLIIMWFSLCKGQVIIGDSPSVKIDGGILVGTYGTTMKNHTYAAFRGIRYTEPMTGNLRFKAPVKASGWVGIRFAAEICPVCVQPSGTTVIGSELCTCLNVFVPMNTTNPEYGLPVLVYISGNTFLSGSSNFNQNLFTDKDIIFVSMTFRLGALGFLSLQTDEVPGNAGMKDQVMALEWVRRHIRKFGGNPNKVTIFGLSGGGIMVELLQLSKMAKGLFHRIISVSGSALSGLAIQPDPLDKANKLAAILGLDSSSETFVEELQGLDASTLVEASRNVQQTIPGSIQELSWSPVVEQNCDHREDCFLGDMPIEILQSGKYNQADAMISVNSVEFLTFYYIFGDFLVTAMLLTPKIVVPISWQSVLSEESIIEVYNIIMDHFFHGETFNISDRSHFLSMLNLLGDVMIYFPVYKYVYESVKTSKRSVYFDEFSVMGLGAFTFTPLGITGSSHEFQILYLSPPVNDTLDEYSPDGWTRRSMMEIYNNFIRQGDPTPGPCTDLLPNKWLPFSKKIANYLSFNRVLIPSVNPNDCRLKFWMNLEKQVFSGVFE